MHHAEPRATAAREFGMVPSRLPVPVTWTALPAVLAHPGLARCRAPPAPSWSVAMTMTPTRFRECLDDIGWSLRKLARRLRCDDGTVRQFGTGRRPIPTNLAAWLESLSAAHRTLSAELREVARTMECDQGKYARNPRGTRPITDEEAALLRAVAAAHAAAPLPAGWGAGRMGKGGENVSPASGTT